MCLLWLQWDTPIDETGSLGRRECHGLLPFSAVAYKVGDLGIFSIGRHCDKGPGSPYERSDSPKFYGRLVLL